MTDFKSFENSVGQVGSIVFVHDGQGYELITLKDAADRLGYSRRQTRRLCEFGILIAIKINHGWLVETTSIERVRNRVGS